MNDRPTGLPYPWNLVATYDLSSKKFARSQHWATYAKGPITPTSFKLRKGLGKAFLTGDAGKVGLNHIKCQITGGTWYKRCKYLDAVNIEVYGYNKAGFAPIEEEGGQQA